MSGKWKWAVRRGGPKIFISYPSPIWLPYKLPPPLLSSSSVIFEVECDKRTKRTHGPDAHTYCLFYCIRLGGGHSWTKFWRMGEKKLQHRFNLWSGKKEGNRSQMNGRIRIRMNVLELTWHWSICCRLWPSDSRALAWGNNGSRVWTLNSVRNVHIAYLLGQNCFRCNYHITRDTGGLL